MDLPFTRSSIILGTSAVSLTGAVYGLIQIPSDPHVDPREADSERKLSALPRSGCISRRVFSAFCLSCRSSKYMARVRVHQHVNPFSPYYTAAPRPVDLETSFADPRLPLHLDIGCARGRFILRMAEAEPGWNFLGVEIREPLVTEANRDRGRSGPSQSSLRILQRDDLAREADREFPEGHPAGCHHPVSRPVVQEKARKTANGE